MVEELQVINGKNIKLYKWELVEPINGNYFDNYNPSNGNTYSLVPDSEKADIDHAVAAAKEAYKTWSKTSKQGVRTY